MLQFSTKFSILLVKLTPIFFFFKSFCGPCKEITSSNWLEFVCVKGVNFIC